MIDDGSFRGTDVFIAPESGQGRQRGRSDIWSLGCCVFEMLTGELPWKNIKMESSSKESVVFKIIISSSGPKVNEKLWNKISPELKDFYKQCFVFVRSDRWEINTRMIAFDKQHRNFCSIRFC